MKMVKYNKQTISIITYEVNKVLEKNIEPHKNVYKIFIAVFAAVCLLSCILTITYAYTDDEKNPDVVITIDSKENIKQTGSLFGDELWYPGKIKKGIIRICNQCNSLKTTTISSLGVGVDLKKARLGYDKETVYNSFLKNMKLTIVKGKLLIFDHNVIENKSFTELLYKPNDSNYTGCKLDDSEQFSIKKDDSIDLKYELTMDKSSGNELQDLSASVNFYINVIQ